MKIPLRVEAPGWAATADAAALAPVSGGSPVLGRVTTLAVRASCGRMLTVVADRRS